MIERKTIEISNQYISTFGIDVSHRCHNCDTDNHTGNVLRFRILHSKPFTTDDIASFRGCSELFIWLNYEFDEYVILKTGHAGALRIISESLFNIPVNETNTLTMLGSYKEEYLGIRYNSSELVMANGTTLFSNHPEECVHCGTDSDSPSYLSDGNISIHACGLTHKDYARSIEIDINHKEVTIGDLTIYIDAIPLSVYDVTSYELFATCPSIDFNKDALGNGFLEGDIYYKEEFLTRSTN